MLDGGGEGEATSDRLLDRAKRLFQFLGNVQRLKGQQIYSVNSYKRDGSVLWLANLPEHPAVTSSHRGGDPAPEDPLLVIDRVPRLNPPVPPDSLKEWLDGPLDDPSQPPELRESIVESIVQSIVPVDADDDGERFASQTVTLDERPDVREQFESWLRQWQIWAAQEMRDRPVRAAYGELFSAYGMATGNPETFELVAGVGCLAWIPASHATVNRHLLTFPVRIRFDEDSGRLTVERAESVESACIELDMLDPALTTSPRLAELRDEARRFEAHPLHRDESGAIVRRLVHVLDAEGQYQEEDEPPAPTAAAVAAFAPAIITRRRSRQGLIKVFETIVDQLALANEVPDGILPLIDPDHRPQQSAGEPVAGARVMVDDDPFLPLPVNEKQLRIIDLVDRKAQTLVQGPPGTGKTHTAAVLIAHLLAQGKRVLATAQTDRALREVRDKLPEAVKPLAVAVVGTAREDMSDLKVAIGRITSMASEHDPKAAQQEIRRCLDSIDNLSRRRAELYKKLVNLREQDVARHQHAGYSGTLGAIAQQLAAQTEEYSWLTDIETVSAESRPPLSTAEIVEWHAYLTDRGLSADEPESKLRLLTSDRVPEPPAFADLVAAEQAAAAENALHADDAAHQAFGAVNSLPVEERQQLQERLRRLAETADDLARRREAWMNEALSDVRLGRAGIWENRARNVQELVNGLSPLVERFGHVTEVVVSGGELGALMALARAVLGFLEKGGRVKTASDGSPVIGPFAPKTVKQARALFEHVRVDGLPPTRAAQLDAFVTWVDATKTLAALDRAWPEGVRIPDDDTLHERLQWHATELEQLRRVVDFGGELDAEQARIDELGLPRPAWTDLGEVRAYARLVDAAAAADRLAAATAALQELEEAIDRAARWKDVAPCVNSLHRAVNNRDHNGYMEAYARLTRLGEVRRTTERRDKLAVRLRTGAPAVAKVIEDGSAEDVWRGRLGKFEDAWAWAQAKTWMTDREGDDANRLQARIADAEKQIRAEVEQLSATRAWNHAVASDRLTGSARANLEQYAFLEKRLGKRGSKYTPQRLAESREALDRCRPAVPVWIMPLYRIAEQLSIRPNIFDVIIIDEASQAGVEATFLQYLAPKMVVIGDDKQVSPAAVGEDQQQLRYLATQFLHDDIFKATWQDPRRSFFDEAKMRYGDMITLTEHRRCVPEIIGFSNKVAYEPDGIRLIPVRQYGADRLDPIKPVFVADGYTRGSTSRVNPAEADKIVEQIEACIADPRYEGRTFGVISLQGPAQAKHIEQKLLERLPPAEWAARDLRCGDSADFQGSERDVIFLSMVAAVEPERRLMALTTEMYVQRYNVAASRAKDQMWVFHSMQLSDLGNPEDMRFSLLDYCYGVVRQSSDEHGAVLDSVPDDERVQPFDSLFEQRVYNRLRRRGYTVIPQYEAMSYRIDLVVVGGSSRLAIECDGDAWHGPEAYTRDLARQRDLERCGWRFHRIRESAFYVDQAAQLEALWADLQKHGIYPSGWTPNAPVEPSSHVPDAPVKADEHAKANAAVHALEPAPDVPHLGETVVASTSARHTTPQPAASADPAALWRERITGAGIEPYEEYKGTYRPTGSLAAANLVIALRDIVAVEGPVVGRRLHDAFAQAYGRRDVTKQVEAAVASAIAVAVRRGILIQDAPLREREVEARTYRLPHQPDARPRTQGPRLFDDVPPLELAYILSIVAEECGWHDNGALHRATLKMTGSTRLTVDVASRLREVAKLIPLDDSLSTAPGALVQRVVAPPRRPVSPTPTRAPAATLTTIVGAAAASAPKSAVTIGPRPSSAARHAASLQEQPRQAERSAGVRRARLSVAAVQRLSSEAAWIMGWLSDNHEVAGADRYAARVERREMDETGRRLASRLNELRKIIQETPIDPTYQPSDFVTPGAIVAIRYEGELDTVRVLVTCQRNLPDGITPVSPFSALGQALAGAEVGQTRAYTHDGRELTVTVIAVHDS